MKSTTWTTQEEQFRVEFMRMKPLKYDGKQRAHLADGWLLCMEEIFDELEIPNDGLKPKLASCTLTLDVKRWWKIVRKHYQIEMMNWKLFTIIFYRHFHNEIEER